MLLRILLLVIFLIPLQSIAKDCNVFTVGCSNTSNIFDNDKKNIEITLKNIKKFSNVLININLAEKEDNNSKIISSTNKYVKNIWQGNDLILRFNILNKYNYIFVDLKLNGSLHYSTEAVYLGDDRKYQEKYCSLNCKKQYHLILNTNNLDNIL